MSETTKEHRHLLREHVRSTGTLSHSVDVEGELLPLLNDADRLAAIERQVLWRTEDMPKKSQYWRKYGSKRPKPRCVYKDMFGQELCGAPDYRPEESGPLFLPILDPPEGE